MPMPYKNYRDGAAAMPVEVKKMETTEDSPTDFLEICAEDILSAVEHKDKKMLAEALRAAFDLLDSEPHVEGEHIHE